MDPAPEEMDLEDAAQMDMMNVVEEIVKEIREFCPPCPLTDAEEAATMAKKEAQRQRLLTKGRLFDIRWKNVLPSSSTPTLQMNGHGEGSSSKGMATATKELLPSAWVLLGRNSILPMSQNFVVTTRFQIKLCYCCWGKVSEFRTEDMTAHVSCPHCMISYKDNSYCIKDLKSEKGTFVNGIKLDPLSPQELVHGDIISLGISHEDPIFKKKHPPKVVFYYQAPFEAPFVPEPVEKAYEEMPAVAALVFGNALILSEIMSSLPLCDLKNMRLVNKEWNKESSKWYYSKSFHVLPSFDCKRWETLVRPFWPYYNNPNVSTAIKIKSEPQWSQAWTFKDDNQRKQWQEGFDQYILNFKSYFQNNGKNIRALDLQMDAKHLHAFTSELNSLRHIKELNLAVDLRAFTKEQVMKLGKELSGEGLPNVEKLTFDFLEGYVSDDDGNTDSKYEEFFKSILKLFPSLSTLVLGFAGTGGEVSPELLAMLKKNPEVIAKLSGFAIRIVQPDQEFFLHCQTIMNLPFKKPLKSLEIGKLNAERIVDDDSDDDDDDPPHQHPPTDPAVFTRLIEKFAENLEHLSLDIGNDSCTDDITELLTYTIPPLPKLKSLELTVCEEALQDVVPLEEGEEAAELFSWLNFPNPDGLGGLTKTVDYAVMFPKLKTLIFKDPGDEEKAAARLFGSRIMEPFIPRTGDAKCPTLTKLVLPKVWRNSSDPEYREWLTRLTEVFPNVHSPLFRAARSGNWDDLEEDKEKEAKPDPYEDSDADVSSSDDDDDDDDDDHHAKATGKQYMRVGVGGPRIFR